MVSEMGVLDTFFLLPAISSVLFSISLLIYSKSWNLCPFLWRNSPYSGGSSATASSAAACEFGCFFGSSLRRLSTRGHLVTIPLPLGRKSRPTIDSITLLLPLDCEPTETIMGNSTVWRALRDSNASYNLITTGISASIISSFLVL